MPEVATPKLSMNVLINKQKSKVLFAEANSDVVDVLLSFLTLPLGKIITILQKHYGNEAPVVGSLTTLRRGLVNLDSTSFSVGGAKKMFLYPRGSSETECHKLKLDISDSHRLEFFYCREWEKHHFMEKENVCLYSDITRCDCGQPIDNKLVYDQKQIAGDGVFTRKKSCFVICDDLRVVPVVFGFSQMVKNVGITDTDGAELSCFRFGMDEVMDLLYYSLSSATSLTDLVMKNRRISSINPQPHILLHHSERESASNTSKKMILKLSLHKSTNKFLFAEATGEFVEFLFSFLTLPLGRVEHLLDGKTCLHSIDNLYRSVTDAIDDEYFMSPYSKIRLINPKQPHGSVSENQFLPVIEDKIQRWKKPLRCESYVKKQSVFIVSDDLTVTPFSLSSSISILNGLGIPLSDVEETELQIGLEEGLSIMKASLTSTTAFTDAIISPMLKNTLEAKLYQPKTPTHLVGEII